MTPRELYQQARIEHYVRQANEFIRMGRYPAARKTVDLILSLDPENSMGAALQAQIDATLAGFLERHNGGRKDKSENSAAAGGGIVQSISSRRNGRRMRSELVLCVDQDERVLTSVGATLDRHGYWWLGAASYEEATGLVSGIVPDVVISEVNFECGPRGFDLFFWFRSNPAVKDIPFLFLATRIDQDTLLAGKRFGVDDFIAKPADGDVIAAAVAQVLQRRRQSDVAA
jgi:PleD family two-component response regulator